MSNKTYSLTPENNKKGENPLEKSSEETNEDFRVRIEPSLQLRQAVRMVKYQGKSEPVRRPYIPRNSLQNS